MSESLSEDMQYLIILRLYDPGGVGQVQCNLRRLIRSVGNLHEDPGSGHDGAGLVVSSALIPASVSRGEVSEAERGSGPGERGPVLGSVQSFCCLGFVYLFKRSESQ